MSSISDGAGRWIGPVLDRASAQLLVWEHAGIQPSQLRVHPEVYVRLAGLRSREMRDGAPLIVLGTDVVADPALAPHEFALTP